MDRLTELRQARAAAIDAMNAAAISRDATAYQAAEAEIAECDTWIERTERAVRAAASLARPSELSPGVIDRAVAAETPAVERTIKQIRALANGRSLRGFEDYWALARQGLGMVAREQQFRTLGEQLQGIFQHYMTKGTQTDPRLVRAPTGAGEVDPTGGGFLVQMDFATALFMLAHDLGDILGDCNTIPISATSNGLKIPGVDETSRATGSRWGGVRSDWVAEGVGGAESRPKFRLVEFDLKKLISKMTVTDELLADAPALTAIAGQAFSEEIMFMTEDAIFEGDGAGKPLGIMNSPALISIAKETGQAAGTIVKENIDKAWSRCWGRSRKTAKWYYNQLIEPQLLALNQIVGTGGAPVYIPPGGYSASPFATLLGRPLVPVEYASALGTVGDIVLADFSQYTLVDKNGVQAATSMHVAFDTDEMRFRVTYRVDGKPMWAAAMTPFKGGSSTLSPFVALATR
jgi:HK97 family phage major capsid protein